MINPLYLQPKINSKLLKNKLLITGIIIISMDENIGEKQLIKEITTKMTEIDITIENVLEQRRSYNQDSSTQEDKSQSQNKQLDVLVSFQQIQELETLMIDNEDYLRPQHLQKYNLLAHKYVYYLIQIQQDCETNMKLAQKTQTKLDSNYVMRLNELRKIFIQKLRDTQLFPYQTTLEQQLFQRMLSKWQFKQTSEQLHDKSYLQTSLKSFIDFTHQQLVNDKCVGCNIFFNRFHPLQNVINKKDVDVHFLYNYSQHQKELYQQNQIKYPPKDKVIRLNHLQDEEQNNLLRQILGFLKNDGGYIMIGCKSLDSLTNSHQILSQNDQRYFNGVHFVVGQTLTQSDKQKINESLDRLIRRITPEISMNKNIKVRYLPVRHSRFNNGYVINKVYSQNTTNKNSLYVILISVNPTQKHYSDTMAESVNLQLEFDPTEDLLQTFDYNQFQHFQIKKTSFNQQEEEQQKFITKSSHLTIFDHHTCKYQGNILQ